MGRKGKETLVEEDIKGRNMFYHTFVVTKHTVPSVGNDKCVYGLRQAMYYEGLKAYQDYTTPTYYDHYFRHLYTILKYIDNNKNLLNWDEQYQYASILRSTLSRQEQPFWYFLSTG